MQDLSKTTLDQYYIVRPLEKPRFDGVRYEAHDAHPMREGSVMLFVVSEHLAQQPNFHNHFMSAMRAARRLYDPSLLQVLDFGLQPERKLYYVVTEMPRGYTLREVIETINHEHTLLLPDVLEIVQQLCATVELVQMNQLPPRDLGPTNILDKIRITPVAKDGETNNGKQNALFSFQVMLTDLGLASLDSNGGTRNPRADVTSLGSLLYRLVVGEAVFAQQRDFQDVQPLSVIYTQLPEEHARVLRMVGRIIQTALAQREVERFESAGLLAADLNRVLPLARRHINLPFRGERATNLAAWLGRQPEMIDAVVVPGASTSLAQRESTLVAKGPPTIALHGLPHEVQVAPGAASPPLVVQVINNSDRDFAFVSLFMEGGPGSAFTAQWWTCNPYSVRLGAKDSPNAAGQFVITFHPPGAPPAYAGHYSLSAVLRYSDREWHDADVKPFNLIVTRTHGCELDIWPQMLRAGEQGVVTITNHGNARETIELSWLGKENQLAFGLEQKRLDRVALLIDAGETGSIEFVAWPQRLHWFGRDRVYPFTVQALTQNQQPLKAPECQVHSRRLIPVWLMLLSVLLLLVTVGWQIGRLSPVVDDVKGCTDVSSVSVPSVAVCVGSLSENIDEVTILPGNQFLDLKTKRTVFAAPAPDLPENVIKLVGHNWLSRLIPLLAAKQTVTLRVQRPAPTAVPGAKARVVEFCVANPALPAIAPICSRASCTNACTPTHSAPPLLLTRGATENLYFTWRTEDLTGYIPDLTPKTINFTLAGNSATAPAPTVPTTYTLTFVDTMGNRLRPLSVQVDVKTITATVTEPELYLRESPGKNYQTLGILRTGDQVILLTQPIDYQQNEDFLHWVFIAVQASGEQGWLACEGLNIADTCAATSAAADQRADLLAAPNPVGSGDTNLNPAGGNTTATVAQGQPASSAAAGGLPVVLPEFGPTVTPTPTETPTLTPTPLPSPTPTATVEPLRIEIKLDKTEIISGECLLVGWTIVGVKEVYFTNASDDKDDLKPEVDNRERSVQFCAGDYGIREPDKDVAFQHIYLRWRITLPDGTVRNEVRKVKVK